MADEFPRRWLSFSNSDQRILCEETHGLLWEGLVVPGTLATYYKQGVGGYVLARRRPFVIDPRTPLLQPVTQLPRPIPRASHETLAGIHDPEVGAIWSRGTEVPFETWTRNRWERAVDSVLDFQASFQYEAAEKISKYEAILAEVGMDLEVPIEGPRRLIPPYWAVKGRHDPWWRLSLAAIKQAAERFDPKRLMPVLCLATNTSLATFQELIAELPDGLDRVFCWAGTWDEAQATSDDIAGWLGAIDAAAMRGIGIVNMYGGALSVMLTGVGLAGVNHGVGYSEQRSEQRLGRTGAPPMRYYVPRLRQFLPVPQAQRATDLLAELGDGWRCDCVVCRGRSTIVDLRTDELKRHFLLSRRAEFEVAEEFDDGLASLRSDAEALVGYFTEPEGYERVIAERGAVLLGWAEALDREVVA